jgi:hypothetical protein
MLHQFLAVAGDQGLLFAVVVAQHTPKADLETLRQHCHYLQWNRQG